METKKFTDGWTDAEGYNTIRPFFKRAYNERKNSRVVSSASVPIHYLLKVFGST